MTDTGTHITMTHEEFHQTIEDTVKTTLAELGVKGYPAQSGRVYRKYMVDVLGRGRYEEAINRGWLKVYKVDPEKSRSGVYTTREAWEQFLKLHTNQNSRLSPAAGGGR